MDYCSISTPPVSSVHKTALQLRDTWSTTFLILTFFSNHTTQNFPNSAFKTSIKSLVPAFFTWFLELPDQSFIPMCQSSPETPSLNVSVTTRQISPVFYLFSSHTSPKKMHLYQHKSEENNNQDVYISSQTWNIWLQPTSHSWSEIKGSHYLRMYKIHLSQCTKTLNCSFRLA